MSESDIKGFTDLVTGRLFPDFCRAPSRRETPYRLVEETLAKISGYDAEWFTRTIGMGLLKEVDGDFLAPRSAAAERIFSHGLKSTAPRELRLWLEPVIGIGALGRLVAEHGWPIETLGLQSETWAFDLAGYRSDGSAALLCEVKATFREVDALSAYFQSAPSLEGDALTGKENWRRKVRWLRTQTPDVVWVLGPNGHERIFTVEISQSDGSQILRPAAKAVLDWRGPSF